MTRKFATARAALCAGGLLLSCAGLAVAGTLTTVDNTSATTLANALTTGGTGGITITGETLSASTTGDLASSGLFSTVDSNNFGLTGSGIVISSGDAAQDGSTGAFVSGITTNFGTSATAGQTNLLDQVASAPDGWHDVTEFGITFTAGPDTNHVYFNTVFTSAEYPNYVGEFIDGFGMFLNGTNIAFAGGNPVNIDSPLMVNTAYPTDGGNDGAAYQTTPEQGVLVENGTAVVTYGGAVIPGSTGNTLDFIVADANDHLLDTTAFIQGLGNEMPPSTVPEPGALSLFGLGLLMGGLVGFARRRRRSREC